MYITAASKYISKRHSEAIDTMTISVDYKSRLLNHVSEKTSLI